MRHLTWSRESVALQIIFLALSSQLQVEVGSILWNHQFWQPLQPQQMTHRHKHFISYMRTEVHVLKNIVLVKSLATLHYNRKFRNDTNFAKTSVFALRCSWLNFCFGELSIFARLSCWLTNSLAKIEYPLSWQLSNHKTGLTRVTRKHE